MMLFVERLTRLVKPLVPVIVMFDVALRSGGRQ